MSERWILTPSGGAPLVLPLTARDGGCQIIAIDTPSPAPRDTWAPRPEGALRTNHEYENREITLQVQLFPPPDQWASATHDFGRPAAETEGDGTLPGWTGAVRRVASDGNPIRPMISDLVTTVSALAPGTARRVLDDDTFLDFDVLAAEISDAPKWDLTYYAAKATTVTVKLICAPFGRGQERLLGEGTKAAGARFLTLDGLQVPGDVPALARLEFTSGDRRDHSTALFAVDQPTEATTTVGIAFDATTLDRRHEPAYPMPTLPGSLSESPVAAILPWTDAETWQHCLSLARAGTPLRVAGRYRVLARVAAGSTETAFRLRWAVGTRHAGMTANRPTNTTARVIFDERGRATPNWSLIDLGVVSVPEDSLLDGVIERHSPTGETVDNFAYFDQVYLLPAERTAALYAASNLRAPTMLRGDVMARPMFQDPAGPTGPLVGSRDLTGQSWMEAYAGSGPQLTRMGVPGAPPTDTTWTQHAYSLQAPTNIQQLNATGEILGEGGSLSVLLGDRTGIEKVARDTPPPKQGVPFGEEVAIRAMATANAFTTGSANGLLGLTIDYTASNGTSRRTVGNPVAARFLNGYASLSLRLDVSGTDAVAFLYDRSSTLPKPIATLSVEGIAQLRPADPSSMCVGFEVVVPPGKTNGADNWTSCRAFTAIGPNSEPDAVLYGDGKLTVSSERATRTSPTGADGPVASYVGDRPFLPPSGPSARPTRVVLGTSHTDLRGVTDQVIDQSFTGRVYATPRYLQIPDSTAGEVTDGGGADTQYSTDPIDGGAA